MTLSSVNRFTKKTLPLPLFVTAATCAVVLLLVVVALVTGTLRFDRILMEPVISTSVDAQSTTYNSTSITRKLLHHHNHHRHHHQHNHHAKAVEPDRFWGDTCSESDIVVNQGVTDPLPNGIPTYTVEIMNVCSTGCDISGIHLSCGWFSSARLINPRLFKRIAYDDCLVNDGKPLFNGHTVSFQYANTNSYPLSVTSVIC